MFDTDLLEARKQRLLSSISGSDLDVVAIVPGANFYYLTGVHFHLMERPTVLFVRPDGTMNAVIPLLEKARWSAAAPDVDTVYWQDSDGFEDAFSTLAKRLDVRCIGVEGQRMRVFEAEALRRAFPTAAIIDAHGPISATRVRKDAAEIAAMERAIAISEACLHAMIADAKFGMSETDLRAKLLGAMLENGADGPAFDPVVLCGPAAADPHGSSSSKRFLAKGDVLLVDFGAAWGGYNADITRTFFAGDPNQRDRDIYDAVLAANALGRQMAAPGVTLHALDQAVTASMVDAGFGDLVVHKTGHGLGQDVHEAPQVMVGNHQPMEAGMVFTVEPGLYFPGSIGVRIEDDVLVTELGCRSLTQFPRQLAVIGN